MRTILLAVVAFLTVTLVACHNSSKKCYTQEEIDSLVYALADSLAEIKADSIVFEREAEAALIRLEQEMAQKQSMQNSFLGSFRIKAEEGEYVNDANYTKRQQVIQLNEDGSVVYNRYYSVKMYQYNDKKTTKRYGSWTYYSNPGYVKVTFTEDTDMLLGSPESYLSSGEFGKIFYIYDGKISNNLNNIKSHNTRQYSELIRN